MESILKNIKIVFLKLSIILFVITIFSCSKTKDEITIGVLPDVDSIPLLIAEKQGFFNQAGVSVKIEHFSSAVNRDTAFQTGAIDGAVSDIMAALLALNGGFSVKITSLTNGSYKLIASGGSNIKSVKDLSGKGVAVSLNTIIEYTTDRIAMSAGVDNKSFEKIVIPQIPVRLEMLKAGKIPAATLPEPLASAALASSPQMVFVESSDNLGINPGVIIFSEISLSKKKKEIAAFYKAYNMAVNYILFQADPVEIEKFLIEEAGFPESVKGVLVLPLYTPAKLPDETEFNEVTLWLLEKDLIEKKFSFNNSVITGLY